MEFKVTLNYGFTSCNCSVPGFMQLTLPGGDVIELQGKQSKITGLLSKNKVLNLVNQLVVKDITNGLRSVVTFDAKKSSRTGYWTSWVKGIDKVNSETGTIDARNDLL